MKALEFLQILETETGKLIGSDLKEGILAQFASDYALKRKNAAHVVHRLLRELWGEREEENPEKLPTREQLRDLYDCRVCVQDIQQVYAKGIMEAMYQLPEMTLFGGEEELQIAEAHQIGRRMAERKSGCKSKGDGDGNNKDTRE